MTDFDELRDRISRIDGGELTTPTVGLPFSITFPTAQTRAVIYGTKPSAIWRWLAEADEHAAIASICHYGLPREDDVRHLIELTRAHPVYFFGDCDPYDLLVFAWLRRRMPIRYLGISDAVVSALGVSMTPTTFEQPEEERHAMAILREEWPEFTTAVGPKCYALLDHGRKLEVEALVSFHTRPVSEFFKLIP